MTTAAAVEEPDDPTDPTSTVELAEDESWSWNGTSPPPFPAISNAIQLVDTRSVPARNTPRPTVHPSM